MKEEKALKKLKKQHDLELKEIKLQEINEKVYL